MPSAKPMAAEFSNSSTLSSSFLTSCSGDSTKNKALYIQKIQAASNIGSPSYVNQPSSGS